MDFVTAVKTCFNKYATFTGRAMRSEYWFFALFYVIVSVIAVAIDLLVLQNTLTIVYYIVAIFLFLPTLAVTVRRLHDTNRSGWWLFFAFVPLVGPILLLVWYCTQGSDQANRFGAAPLGLAKGMA
jgi:uncharacterized membrane protein YhaH (DUF805 family)